MANSIDNITARQWTLYNFLRSNYKEGVYIDKFLISQVCGYPWNPKSNRNGREIENDVRAINDCDRIQKIIVSNKEGYKIGNREETLEYIKSRFMRDFKSLKLSWKLTNKVKMDGQTCLQLFGKERTTIEAFITIQE